MVRIVAAVGLFVSLVSAHCRQDVASTTPERTEATTPPAEHAAADRPPAAIQRFRAEVQPILATHCQPCHFPGGKMYEALPFDRPETITRLGERVLSRIDDEREQRVIRDYLASLAVETGDDDQE